MSKKEKIYEIVIAILALISIILVVLDFANILSLEHGFWMWIDNAILIVFAIDYFTRLIFAKNKWKFFKENIFDLLSIIPVNGIFVFFRFARLGRVARLFRLLRLLRLVGLTGRLHKLLHTNGLIYLLYASISLLLVGAVAYSLSEHASLMQSIWWAIATATTVGYGDISPHTIIGKIVAFVLMLVGIGVIGMLTSTLTTYFLNNNDKDQDTDNISDSDQLTMVLRKLDKIEKQNIELKQKLEKFEQNNSDSIK